MKKNLVVLVAGVALGASAETVELTGPDLWAQRASHPAVVNPVLGQDAVNVTRWQAQRLHGVVVHGVAGRDVASRSSGLRRAAA